MKILILLFLILLILIITSKIEIAIGRLEYINRKIKFYIKINIYILNKFKILSKKIRKKDVMKILTFVKRKIEHKPEDKNRKKLLFYIKEIYIEINYGIKKIYPNIYIYSIINALIPMTLEKYQVSNAKYKINTNFNKNELNIKLKSKIEIKMFDLIKNYISEKFSKTVKNKKQATNNI